MAFSDPQKHPVATTTLSVLSGNGPLKFVSAQIKMNSYFDNDRKYLLKTLCSVIVDDILPPEFPI